MSNTEELSLVLHGMIHREKVLLVSWTPKDIDSTTFAKLHIKLTISSLNGGTVSIALNPYNTLIMAKLLVSLHGSKPIPLIGHGWKDLFTFFNRTMKQPYVLNNVFDLSWYESYLKLPSSEGNNNLIIEHFKQFIKNESAMNVYKKVYDPLISKAIPAMESYALLDENEGYLVYPRYHVESQENGRLSCSCSGKRCYNPHSLGPEKSFLKINEPESAIFRFDYKNMEVAVLGCLSEDSALLSIINEENKDVYTTLFEEITGIKDRKDARALGKKMFLPVVYGQTAIGLSKVLDISIDQANVYFDKIQKLFPRAFSYVEGFQASAKKDKFVKDCFGRIRRFEMEDEVYKARNFAIQSPAALICIESLIKLYYANKGNYRLAFHVHDGYYLTCKKQDMHEVYIHAKKTLEESSDFMPKLQLKVSVEAGKSLDNMVILNNKR